MIRRADWQSRLESFLHANAHHPFAYGSWDCCLFVSSAIHQMTDVDPAHEFRNNYSSRGEAYRSIKAATGAASLEAVVTTITDKLQMPLIPVLCAQRGDVVLLNRAARDYSLGLVSLNGREIIVCRRDGLCRISLARAIRAWRV
jgi:hypothetical protein